MSRFARLALIAWVLAVVGSVWWAVFLVAQWHPFLEGSSLVLGGLVPLVGLLSGLGASFLASSRAAMQWSVAAAGINGVLFVAFVYFVFPNSVWEEMLREWGP